MTCYIIDTETTGQEPPECIELAYATWDGEFLGATICERFKPNKPSTHGALAVHHILDSELVACSPASHARVPDDAEYIIGHNVDYDWQVLGSPDVRRIDTLALARKLYPSAESHKLGAMLYMLYESPSAARDLLRNAHSADADVGICYVVLTELLRRLQWGTFDGFERLWKFSEMCRIPTVWTFGKFKGQAISAADRGYMNWYLRQADTDPYVVEAIRRVLDK